MSDFTPANPNYAERLRANVAQIGFTSHLGKEVLRVEPGRAGECKINFLALGRGEALIARGEVIKPGRTMIVCRADVFSVVAGEETLCATMLATTVCVPEIERVKRLGGGRACNTTC